MRPAQLLDAWDDLRAGLYRSAGEIEELQLSRLRAVVEHSYENVPFYRRRFDQAGFHPRHLKRLEDVAAIPITTRAAVQKASPDDLIARGYSRALLRPTRTGGSTGAPLTVYRTRQERNLSVLLRLRQWTGHRLRLTDRILTVSSMGTTPGLEKIQAAPRMPGRWNHNVLDEFELILRTFVALQPSVFYGYSYHVALIARAVEERQLRVPAPRLVATSGDLLLPQFRSTIRRVWNTDPIDIYSSSDVGDMAWQCHLRERPHMNSDQMLFEFLRDGKAVPEREQGELVVTHFYRHAMPLIRYSSSDFGASSSRRCPCGIRLPLMESLQGRLLNAVPLPGGRSFVGFNRVMSDEPSIETYQVVQSALGEFEVNVVLGSGHDAAPVLARIESTLARHLGAGVKVRAAAVNDSALIRKGSKVPAVIPFQRVDFGNGDDGR